MKYLLYIIIPTLILTSACGQTIIWSEDFDGNGGAGSNWGTLNQNIGVQGITANRWYISGQECGNAAGVCGSTCAGDFSLHVSSTTVGDLGAAYDASAACLPGCFICDFFGAPPFCTDVTTNKRSQSININTTGHTTLTLNFNYIELGQGTTDDCIAEYSIDGGASWLTLINTPKPALGACAPQGTWTAFSMALPVTCENITNLRIAFRWQNNADGVGSDPSFAVDDITITKPTILPISLLSFKGELNKDNTLLEWITESEFNNDYFTIERSEDAVEFTPIIVKKGQGNSNTSKYYSATDYNASKDKTSYYRLKQTDFNGRFTYSEIISINPKEQYEIKYLNHNLSISSSKNNIKVVIYDIMGKEVYSNIINSNHQINTSSFQSGIYILKVGTTENVVVRKLKF